MFRLHVCVSFSERDTESDPGSLAACHKVISKLSNGRIEMVLLICIALARPQCEHKRNAHNLHALYIYARFGRLSFNCVWPVH